MSRQYTVLPLSETSTSAARWDAFVEDANGGTIFHRLDFLAYHGDRFKKTERHLVIMKGEEVFGVMPLAVFEENGQKIGKSPYGASYGGPVFRKKLSYSESTSIVTELLVAIRAMKIDKLTLTLPIAAAYSEYCETFRLCLYEHGFHAVNRDISSVVALSVSREKTEATFDSRGRNMTRKAQRLGVEIVHGAGLDLFWPVLLRTYEKHQTSATHSKEELAKLVDTFPDRVYFDIAIYRGEVVAGVGYFVINARMNSSFYFANIPERQDLQALSLLVSDALAQASDRNFKFFDFGTSSVGMKARSSIFQFKESFGAFGCFRDTFAWSRNV